MNGAAACLLVGGGGGLWGNDFKGTAADISEQAHGVIIGFGAAVIQELGRVGETGDELIKPEGSEGAFKLVRDRASGAKLVVLGAVTPDEIDDAGDGVIDQAVRRLTGSTGSGLQGVEFRAADAGLDGGLGWCDPHGGGEKGQ